MIAISAATADYRDFGPKLRSLQFRPPPSTTAILSQRYDNSDLGSYRRLPRCSSKVTIIAISAATADYRDFGPKLRSMQSRPPPTTTAILVPSYDNCDLGRHRRLPRFWFKVTIIAISAATVDYRD